MARTRAAYTPDEVRDTDDRQELSAPTLPWRAPHENAAEQLARRVGCNVIEGDHDLA